MNIGAPEFVMAIGVILTFLNILDKGISLTRIAKAPEQEQNRRIEALEENVRKLNSYIASDDTRIIAIENSNKVILHSMSALLAHGIDGNNTEKLIQAKEELDRYLIAQVGGTHELSRE